MPTMRALGPGSLSSLLKAVLDVVRLLLLILLAILAAGLLYGVLAAFNPDMPFGDRVRFEGLDRIQAWAVVLARMLTATLFVAGVLVIVSRLREVFATLKAGDPFHPDNVTRLRVVAAGLAGLELVRYAVWLLGALLPPQAAPERPNLSLTAWFSILVVVVLAEVFREGARLRREAELTI
jgi:hypothetical protein